MPRVYIETYGCQMNLADTELMRGHLARSGFASTEDPTEADVILLNTCAIREHAEERIFGRLGDLARHKTRRPHVQIGLAGCMAQHFRDRLLSRTPLDFVVGPDAYRRLPALLGGDPFVDVRLDRDETYGDFEPERGAGVRAWVTVMRGCDKFCTFCIVPYVRGRERSLPMATVLEQVRHAAAEGFREVVFLGQTVNAYRDGATDFGALLRAANDIDGIRRIRFTSPHPSDMSDSAIEAMASCAKVCPQLHLPVQSGSTQILERMERGYSAPAYLRLVDRLRLAVPGIALTTDVIVGFPGESEEDFEATLELMRTVRYDGAFMFKYSKREHTKAYRWEETVAEEEKSRRLQAVIAEQEGISAEINRALVGGEVEVLVEGPARRREGWLAGKTPHFKTVVFPAAGATTGELVKVRVDDATAHTLIGRSQEAGVGRREILRPSSHRSQITDQSPDMAQTWDPERYARNARFVADLATPVVELLQPKAGERVLDLGCGDGVLTEALRGMGCEVVGVDASAAQVEAARDRGLEAYVADGERLDFHSEFDAVFSNAALHWMKSPDAVIAGVRKALKPGGRFVGEMGGQGCIGRIQRALCAELERRGVDPAPLDPWYFPSDAEYRGRLEAHGFEVDSIALIDRPTRLPGDIGGWLETFAESYVCGVPPAERPALIDAVRERLRADLCGSDGVWTADYVRLRFAARLGARC